MGNRPNGTRTEVPTCPSFPPPESPQPAGHGHSGALAGTMRSAKEAEREDTMIANDAGSDQNTRTLFLLPGPPRSRVERGEVTPRHLRLEEERRQTSHEDSTGT